MSGGSFQSGCAGKLPSFADFVRYNASSRESIAFDQWLQHGLYAAQSRLGHSWGKSYLGSPAYDFLFWPENSERFLVGHLQPSHDRAHREYPFSVSLLVDRPRLGEGHIALVPLLFSGFLAGARGLVRRALSGLELRTIEEATQVLSVPLPLVVGSGLERHAEFLRDTTFREFSLRLFDSVESPMRLVLFRHLIEILLPLQRWSMQRLKFGLRFPLPANGATQEDEVSYWLQLCVKIAGASQFAPVAFWTSAEGNAPRYLFLFFRQPSPKILLQLLLPEDEQDSVCILEKDVPGAVTGPAFTARHQAILDEPSATLKTILDKLP